jgi:hypothetical protein
MGSGAGNNAAERGNMGCCTYTGLFDGCKRENRVILDLNTRNIFIVILRSNVGGTLHLISRGRLE